MDAQLCPLHAQEESYGSTDEVRQRAHSQYDGRNVSNAHHVGLLGSLPAPLQHVPYPGHMGTLRFSG